MKKRVLSVIVPCFNEEKTIAKVVQDFKNALPTATIYVYDNNSTDNTVKLLKKRGVKVKKKLHNIGEHTTISKVKMIRKNIRVNNEFYVAPVYNEMIEDGKKIVFKDVGEKMHGLGTPEDLERFLCKYTK